MDTPYSHCLFLAYSNTVWACADSAYTCTHSPGTLPPPHTSLSLPTVASWTLSALRQRDRKTERDQWTQGCACYLHPNLQFLSSLFSSPFSLCSNLQIQQSVTSTCSHANILSIFTASRQTGCAFKHMVVTCKMTRTNSFRWARTYKLWRHTQWSESIAAVSRSSECLLN